MTQIKNYLAIICKQTNGEIVECAMPFCEEIFNFSQQNPHTKVMISTKLTSNQTT